MAHEGFCSAFRAALEVPSFGDLMTICDPTARQDFGTAVEAFAASVTGNRRHLVALVDMCLLRSSELESEEGFEGKLKALRPDQIDSCVP